MTRNSTAAALGASSVYGDWTPVVEIEMAGTLSNRQSAIKLTTRPDLSPSWAFIDTGFDTSWMTDADCTTVDPELWQPPRNAKATKAKAICASCPVRVECLDYALRTDTRDGVWGGVTERPRRGIRGAMKRQGLVLDLDDLEALIAAYDAGRLDDYLGPLDHPDDEEPGELDLLDDEDTEAVA